ncbi:hypothetical protein K440DRAFT_642494 [Wilcoxina mikolae CBS 423.85]|nr:hypothetical protein K440DRAFT_642494 [Wilcoxina mikolae CBS 423.85]
MHPLHLLILLPLLAAAQSTQPACVKTCITNYLGSSWCDGGETGDALATLFKGGSGERKLATGGYGGSGGGIGYGYANSDGDSGGGATTAAKTGAAGKVGAGMVAVAAGLVVAVMV